MNANGNFNELIIGSTTRPKDGKQLLSPSPRPSGMMLEGPTVLDLLDFTRQAYELETENVRRSYQEAIAKLRDEISKLQGILSAVGLHVNVQDVNVQDNAEEQQHASMGLAPVSRQASIQSAREEKAAPDSPGAVKPAELQVPESPPLLAKLPSDASKRLATSATSAHNTEARDDEGRSEDDTSMSPCDDDELSDAENVSNQLTAVVPGTVALSIGVPNTEAETSAEPPEASVANKEVQKFKQARIRCSFESGDDSTSRRGSGISFAESLAESFTFPSMYSSVGERASLGSDVTPEITGPYLKLQVMSTWSKDPDDGNLSRSLHQGSSKKDFEKKSSMLSFKIRGKSGSNVFSLPPELVKYSWYDRLVLDPNSPCLIAWSLLGFAFILFDLIVIPFQVFDPPRSTSLRVLEMTVIGFWTVDVIVNFFSGYTKPNGINELRLRQTALNYVKSWFLPDAFLVSVDWLVFLSEVFTDNMGLLRVGKLARLSKTIRVVRLFRLAKVDGFWGQITKKFNSEELATLLGLAGRFLGVIICCHWVACAWFGITIIQGEDTETWMKFHQPADRGITYRYFTAMHWAMTQFTPASMEVYPHNTTERILNVIVLLLGLLTFTTLISSISGAMSHLQNLNNVNFLRQQHLRKWMGENKVSMALVTSVWACVKNSKQHTQRTPQKDVELLKVLPKHVLAQLCEEVLQPVFETHPFFSSYLLYNPTSMRRLCSSAIQETYLYERDELFNCGDMAERAFFVRTGRLVYESMPEQKASMARSSDARQHAQMMRTTTRHFDVTRHSNESVLSSPGSSSATLHHYGSGKSSPNPQVLENSPEHHPIEAGKWLSEIALWAEWTHCGPLFATSDSELVSIDCKVFCTTMGKYVVQDAMLRRYALLYAQRAVHELRLLDIWFEPVVLEDLAWCSFFEDTDLTEGLPDSVASIDQCGKLLQIPPAAPQKNLSAQQQLRGWHQRVQELREEEEEDETTWHWRSMLARGIGDGGKTGRTSGRGSYRSGASIIRASVKSKKSRKASSRPPSRVLPSQRISWGSRPSA